MELAPGTVLGGRYEIVRLLGQGGMGSVYEVRHTGTRKRMALKVITADVTQHPGLVARFQVEARASGAIESQHIAQVFDVGSDEELKLPYMAMEFLVGEDLESLLHRLGPLPPQLALRIVAQACAGLEKAHQHDVVHRDIKPANIFVARRDDEDIVVKLLDFGIAKILQDEEQEGPGLTRTGALIGSPLYMSPEQARGRRGGVDQRTDVWSMGTVLYQLLCGRTPHHDQEAMGDLIIAICSDPAPSVQRFAPWIPPEIDRIIHKALQIDVERRYQSAGEMLADVRALLPEGSSIHAGMLSALDEVMRSHVAPRTEGRDTEADDALSLKLETGPGGQGTTMPSALRDTERPPRGGAPLGPSAATALSPGQEAPAPPPEPSPEGAAAAARTAIPSVTTGALATDATPRKSSSSLLIGGAAIAVVAGVAAAFAIFSGDGRGPGASSASPATSGAPASPDGPKAPPEAAPSGPTAAPSAQPPESTAKESAPAAPEVTPSAAAPSAVAEPPATPSTRATGAPPPGPRPPAAPSTAASTAAPPASSTKKNPLDVTIK